MEIFTLIDKKRADHLQLHWATKHPGVNPSHLPPLPGALMTIDEVPAWINDNSWQTRNIQALMGSGGGKEEEDDEGWTGGEFKRKRKDVVYDDNMTEQVTTK